MHIPRRDFLKTGALSALSAGVAFTAVKSIIAQDQSGGSQIPLKAQESPVFNFTRGTFERYVGDIFQVPNARGEMLSLVLLDVTTYKTDSNTRLSTKTPKLPNSFSLTFSSDEKLPEFTSIHKMSHPALGKFDLFLTSRHQDNGSFLHDAIINHTN